MAVRQRSPSARLHLLLACLCLCMAGISVEGVPMPAPGPAPPGKPTLAEGEIEILRKIDEKLGVGWNFSVDPCSGDKGWKVDKSVYINNIVRIVTCGNCDMSNTCHVTNLLIKTQNLTGTLPVEIANLTSLIELDLTRNYISGPIPPEWSSLPLVNLSLGNNRISGSIPLEFGKISTFNSLVLENNLLTGSIPAELGRLTNLTRLIISGNDLTGKIPDSLANLKNLIDFRIDGNGISGKIPGLLGNWTKVLRLHMQGTSLEGPFPPVFSSLPNLIELRVTDLKGVQSFPPNITMGIKHIILRNCSISGKLPAYVGALNRLKTLDLSFNKFTGEIPSAYKELKRVKRMYLGNNRLTGPIPDWITRSKQKIDLSFNHFQEPSLTECMPQGSQVNMFASCSSSNDASIPPCFRKNYPCSGNAENYNLFINCGGRAIKFDGHQYDGDLAPKGGSTFYTSPNKKWAFTSTGDFFFNDLANYTAKNNTVLNMSNPEMYMTARLSPSSLRYYGSCLINGNYTVNLHFAEIIFIDSKTFYGVGRRFFDVSIQGKLVLEDFNIAVAANGTGRSIVKSFTAVVKGNTLEIEFRWSGKGTNSVPQKGVYGPLVSAISVTPDFTPPKEGGGLSIATIVGIAIAALVVVLLLAFMIQCLVKRCQPNDNKHLLPSMVVHFTLKQIKSATRNFSDKIGEGGFGPVFKGILPDGTRIAIKQLSPRSRQGIQEFINEIGLISPLQHPNLVRLLGFCIDGNQLFLVYEYMENNSLGHVLFGDKDKSLILDWKTRRNICLGMAKGLTFLHESSIKVIHRDIKATNVLLDKDLSPKISDFGLAKLCNQDQTHISTRIAGTTGYMAPEYATRGQLTVKADVYSFGIVMLEVVSGKCCVTRTPNKDNVYLLDLAIELEESGRILQLVDEKLGGDYSKEEAVQIIKLALLCASTSPSNRPTMGKVLSVMESNRLAHVPSVRPEMTEGEEEKLRAFVQDRRDDDHRGVGDASTGPSDRSPAVSSLQASVSHFMPSYHCEDLPR